MTETILIALIIAKIKGYKLKPLIKHWEMYPVLLFALIYLIIEITIFRGNYSFIKYSGLYKVLYLCSFLALIIKYQQYFGAFIGSVFMIAGGLLNKIAIGANNGKMPVFPTLSYVTGYYKSNAFTQVKDLHVLGTGVTRMKFLTDIFDVGYSIMSLGDICIRLFAFIIIYNSIKYINKIDIVRA